MPTWRPGPPRRRLSRTVALVTLLSLAAVLPAAGQERGPSDISRDLDEARGREDAARGELSDTERRLRDAADELSAIQQRLAAAQADLRRIEGQRVLAQEGHDDAQERTAAAEGRLAVALGQLGRIEQQLGLEELALQGQVASAYKYGSAGQGAMFLRVIRDAETPNDVATGMYKLRSIMSYQSGIVGRVELLRNQQAATSAEADRSREAAVRAQREAAHALEVITGLRDEALAVAEAVAADEARQAAILAELASDRDAQRRVLAEVADEQLRLEREYEQELARRRAAGAGNCPVDGARVGRDFGNDWGYPRPGSRSHEGTDIFASRGTPVRAMYHGIVKEVRHTDSGLGGRVVSYWVASGEHWYNAHLDTVAQGLQVGDPVSPGMLIGTVGQSGNARTTPPHLHIGHYVDDVARNPYPVLADACP